MFIRGRHLIEEIRYLIINDVRIRVVITMGEPNSHHVDGGCAWGGGGGGLTPPSSCSGIGGEELWRQVSTLPQHRSCRVRTHPAENQLQHILTQRTLIFQHATQKGDLGWVGDTNTANTCPARLQKTKSYRPRGLKCACAVHSATNRGRPLNVNCV